MSPRPVALCVLYRTRLRVTRPARTRPGMTPQTPCMMPPAPYIFLLYPRERAFTGVYLCAFRPEFMRQITKRKKTPRPILSSSVFGFHFPATQNHTTTHTDTQ